VPRFLLRLAVICALLVPAVALAQRPTAPLQEFPTEQQAQAHCPTDIVVWLNLPTGIFHLKGQRWYGRTNSGAYVCEHEADQAGMRETRNGQ
jgi:hypothetical protein